MSELKQTKLAVIVTGVITLLLLIIMPMDFIRNTGNVQSLIFLLFIAGLFMTLGLLIKLCVEYVKENDLW